MSDDKSNDNERPDLTPEDPEARPMDLVYPERVPRIKTIGANRREDKAIIALLEHINIQKAAASIGMSDVWLWRLTKKPYFQEALRTARIEAFSRAVARLQQASSAAVTTLLKIMIDPTTPPATRVRAAVSVLELASRATEIDDLAHRVEKLEEMAKNSGVQLD